MKPITLSDFIILVAIIYSVAIPILAYFCWKYPLFLKRVRSIACNGYVYERNDPPSEDMKKFGEWAGFKSESTLPTSP